MLGKCHNPFAGKIKLTDADEEDFPWGHPSSMNNNANSGLWWNSHYLNVAQCPLPAPPQRHTTHYHNILLIHFEFRGKLYYVPTMKCQFESTHQPTQHPHKYMDTNLCRVWPKSGEWCTSIVTLSKWVVAEPVAVHPATRTHRTESYIHSGQHTILFPINQNHPLFVGENFLTRIYYPLPYIKSVCFKGYSESFFTPLRWCWAIFNHNTRKGNFC